ncbi:hypothetical protein Goklo_024593 [Gossypium klotzschianum]|uniref:Uncharacterized protein n=1 Tax=Gossypium klotzschianum TaxID=34286 RepID=A0A7J8W997_9ROSI|nr:hypothetical protein [Gossypium klotzschianum]
MEGDKGTVCVTEVIGFIVSWLIKSLLQEVTLFIQLLGLIQSVLTCDVSRKQKGP